MLRCHGNLLINKKNRDDGGSIYVKQAMQLFQKIVRLRLLQLKLEFFKSYTCIEIEKLKWHFDFNY